MWNSFSISRFPFTGTIALTAFVSLVTALDQVTKYVVISRLPEGAYVRVIPGFFRIVHFRNSGAAWGILQGYTGLLSLFSVVVCVVLIVWFRSFADGFWERTIALGLLLAGIIGNLIDRILRQEVIDFLLVFFRGFRWPAFNVADCAICVGVGIYIASSLFRREDFSEQHAERRGQSS